jgi:hypothetical protein
LQPLDVNVRDGHLGLCAEALRLRELGPEPLAPEKLGRFSFMGRKLSRPLCSGVSGAEGEWSTLSRSERMGVGVAPGRGVDEGVGTLFGDTCALRMRLEKMSLVCATAEGPSRYITAAMGAHAQGSIFKKNMAAAMGVQCGSTAPTLRFRTARLPTARGAAPPSPLERREKLEQLRALELGMTIWSAVLDEAPISVDNPYDLERARAHARRMGDPA